MSRAPEKEGLLSFNMTAWVAVHMTRMGLLEFHEVELFAGLRLEADVEGEKAF